jgi:hypothetical protein
MKIIEHTLLLFAAFTLFTTVEAQTYSPQQIEIAERLHTLAQKAAPEIAYIQTSKDIFETGEDLWFKVYLLNAQSLLPSLLSETLYLQLLNEESKKVVWQEKYEISNGFANGRVYLETSLPEGNYFLSAYTPNSFYNDTIEHKAVRRVKIKTDITSTPIKTSIFEIPHKTPPIQFTTFPEGGNLISGIQSKLAFKAVTINGEPVNIAGTIFEDSTPLLEFKSTHAGMGSFDFTPNRGKKYLIRLEEPAIDSTFLLPEIYPEGISMQLVDRDKESLSFKVSQSPGLKQEIIYLRVQCRGIVYGMTMAELTKEIIIKVPLSLLPQGIAEVTLFNSSLIPVAERLVYVNQNRKLNITTELSKEIYPTRGKVALKITVKDENGQPVVANLGVSVSDKIYQNPQDSNNILTHYYLSTQLKGRIYNPSFYFNNSREDRVEMLDLLMLTQGWRKYVWSESNLNKSGESRQKIIFDGVKGELIIPSIWKKNRREQSFVMIFSSNLDKKNVLIPSDSQGVFIVPSKYLKVYEGDNLYLKPFGPHASMPIIKITDPFETINLAMKANEIFYPVPIILKKNGEIPDISMTRSDVIKIEEVTIKAPKTNIIRGKYMGTLDSLSKFDLKPGANIEDYVCKFGIWNCENHSRDDPGSTKPKSGKMYYDNSGRPHVAIYPSPYQEYTEADLMKKFNLTRVKGYFGNREFYQPNYDKETEEAIIPDFRNILLWEPEVITNEKGEATLSFYCSDIYTDFVGRIEGVGGEGLLGTDFFKFTVRKLKVTP